MDLLVNLVTGFLSLYLAFTSALAASIESLLPAEPLTESAAEIVEKGTQPLAQANKNYEYGGDIPDILIKNSAYQQAAIIEAYEAKLNSATVKEALVNVFCTYKTDEYIRATTGTGWFIHRDGLILTNAHVAMTLLLAEITGDSKCIIRTGDPAKPTYQADLLYISPLWLRENAAEFKEASPKGTGERDYAILYVSQTLNNDPLPAEFPAISFDTTLLNRSVEGSSVVAAGYPAEALVKQGQQVKLSPIAATTTVAELMTFGSNYVDLFTIAGSEVGQHGASGGPVVDQAGNAIGLITTRGEDEKFGAGSLRAITVSYIDRTIMEETGFSLADNLTGNLPYRAKLYKDTMVPFLKQVLQWELE